MSDVYMASLLVLRHAEKEGLLVGDKFGNDVSLTPFGKQQTRKLASDLHERTSLPLKIKTSPVRRCLETAKLLLDEKECEGDFFKARIDSVSSGGVERQARPLTAELLKPTSELGGPGVYVDCAGQASAHFLDYGVRGVVERQLLGKHMPGIRECASATNTLLRMMLNDMSDPSVSTIYVTHDVILAAFFGNVVKAELCDFEWFGYLEGITLGKRHDDGYELCRGGQVFDITERVYDAYGEGVLK